MDFPEVGTEDLISAIIESNHESGKDSRRTGEKYLLTLFFLMLAYLVFLAIKHEILHSGQNSLTLAGIT